jgi:hypothetical protein
VFKCYSTLNRWLSDANDHTCRVSVFRHGAGLWLCFGYVPSPFVVPRMGERWAELVKMPIMAVVGVFIA